MSWLQDSGLGDEKKRKEEFEKRRKAEAQRLDAMVSRLLNDVGEAKWGHHFSWDRSMTILPLGNVKHYKLESARQPWGWSSRWTVTGGHPETTYYVDLIMGNPSQGTSNHFEVYEWEGQRVVTLDTSESELMNALKKVIVG